MSNNALWEKFNNSIDTKTFAADVEKAAAEGDNRTFEEVPHGSYEVAVTKLELTASKKGDPMVKAWFQIVAGNYEKQYIFMNQPVTLPFQIHKVNIILRSLIAEVPDIDVVFESFSQFGGLLMDILEAIDGKFEYELAYTAAKNGFSNYEIKKVFPLSE